MMGSSVGGVLEFAASWTASKLIVREFSSRRRSLMQSFLVELELPIYLSAWFKGRLTGASYLKLA